MKRKQTIRRWAAAMLAAVCGLTAGSALPGLQAEAKNVLVGYVGDLDRDMDVDLTDAVHLAKLLTKAQEPTAETSYYADVNVDGRVDIFDLVMLKKILLGKFLPGAVYLDDGTPEDPEETTTTTTTTTTVTTTTTTTTEAQPDPVETTTTATQTDPVETTTTTTTTTESTTPEQPQESPFLVPPIAQLGASLPTQGKAQVVVFYVDFPDCPYRYAPSAEELETITFGAEDPSSSMYPFESISAYFQRSSKGQLAVGGKVFRYTTKENKAAYEADGNKVKLTEECYAAFRDSEDFAAYDGNGDGKIDCTILTVPTEAGEDNWWPCAGAFGDDRYRVDGMSIGHIITGNAQVESRSDFGWYTSSYIHEMGHCTGLPDYYLYGVEDYEGMHGSAGTEMMDVDACSDFCAFSKLMLGWYREDQVAVYDVAQGTQRFTLHNAQTDDGNCVIIPRPGSDGSYFSEYFILEYSSLERNNSNIGLVAWWQAKDSGVRVHHVDATLLTDYWGKSFKYASGSEYTNHDNGRRLIRITEDVEGASNFYKLGEVVSHAVSGFAWYDSNDQETIDPGISIRILAQEQDSYVIEIGE